jgi:hypothetical protein
MFVSTKSFQALKRAEARQRMASLRRAQTSRRAARAEDRRHGLVNGAEGRIVNLSRVMRAMAAWSKPGH